MLRDRARRHYEQRGHSVLEAPAGGPRVDLVVEKAGRRRFVRVDDDPFGAYQIGALAAEAKRAKAQATVICPGTPDVIEACEKFGVEHISPEGLGEEGPIIARRPVAPTPIEPVPVPAVQETAPEPVAMAVSPQPVPMWRWAIVAVIWLLAAVMWTILLVRVF